MKCDSARFFVSLSMILFVALFTWSCSSSSGPSETTHLLSEPIAYFPFNGNADDESGNGEDGTVNGAVLTTDRFDDADAAYSFNGTDQYIQTPLTSNMLPLSFSVWFKSSANWGERSIVDSDVAGDGGHSLITGWWGGDDELDVEYHGGGVDSDYSIELDTWYHAVVTFSDVIRLYVDGEKVGEDFDYSTYDADGDDFRFGRHNVSDPQWFSGKIDDVRFYDWVLTQTHVDTLYSEGGWTGR
ncbi:MAG: LamG domain-containing protein [Candidatus Eisenbacteria bacterium]|nr:LamG domain-containing protein [Candidatus Eisenbacteria bacterium]